MKKKEPVGDSDELPAEVVDGLASSTADKLEVCHKLEPRIINFLLEKPFYSRNDLALIN
mgnify:CR=1 FL=1